MIQLSCSSARRDHSCDRESQVQEETVENSQQSTKLEKTARIRVLVFLFFHFPSVEVRSRSSKIEVFGMATVGRGYNELQSVVVSSRRC